jgi:bifunctional DNA-binding transcriptional regulator/antitoxin component of YhaV-PrlF toxin-antitoxin module
MKTLLLITLFIITGCTPKATMNNQNNYSEGLAIFDDNSHFGFVNKKGKIVIPAKFWKVYDFSEGVAGACLEEHKKCGYINHKGEFVITPKYNDVHKFKNGKAVVYKNGEFYYINKKGEFLKKTTLGAF